jgi:uncharacterized protein YndB with AHSA1/START domain
MPSFDDVAATSAPPEEVWKVLYDPARFPEWWTGIEAVRAEPAVGGAQSYTMYPDGYPDFPMPQVLRSSQNEGLVTISCLVSDLVFEWRLEPAEPPSGTLIRVHVEIPEVEAARLEGQREVISSSLSALARLAEQPG